jgi:hypothetical protein
LVCGCKPMVSCFLRTLKQQADVSELKINYIISPYAGYISHIIVFICIVLSTIIIGARGSVVVKALSYKPEGRVFDSRLGDF